MKLSPNGLTKAWRGLNGERKLTVREAAHWGPSITVFLSRNFAPEFIYLSCGVRGHWARWHWLKKAA